MENKPDMPDEVTLHKVVIPHVGTLLTFEEPLHQDAVFSTAKYTRAPAERDGVDLERYSINSKHWSGYEMRVDPSGYWTPYEQARHALQGYLQPQPRVEEEPRKDIVYIGAGSARHFYVGKDRQGFYVFETPDWKDQPYSGYKKNWKDELQGITCPALEGPEDKPAPQSGDDAKAEVQSLRKQMQDDGFYGSEDVVFDKLDQIEAALSAPAKPDKSNTAIENERPDFEFMAVAPVSCPEIWVSERGWYATSVYTPPESEAHLHTKYVPAKPDLSALIAEVAEGMQEKFKMGESLEERERKEIKWDTIVAFAEKLTAALKDKGAV